MTREGVISCNKVALDGAALTNETCSNRGLHTSIFTFHTPISAASYVLLADDLMQVTSTARTFNSHTWLHKGSNSLLHMPVRASKKKVPDTNK